MTHAARLHLALPLLAALAAAAPVMGQAPAAAEDAASQIVHLDPFAVSESTEGYNALNSNSLTQFNAAMYQMPISADVFDQQFMQDIAATSVEGMLANYVAGAGYSYASPDTYSNQPGDRATDTYISLRGVSSPIVRRDGFLPLKTYQTASSTSQNYSSNFDLDRVDVLLGPQALLYGNSGAGGAINLISKQAHFGQPAGGSLMFQVDQWGHKLGQLDFDVGAKNVALRVALIDSEIGGHRLNVGGPLHGAYAQLAVQVANTTIRIDAEDTYDRTYDPALLTYAAANTANDARNSEPLHYLLATGQLPAAAGGAPSGGGYIGNGFINWDNIDSYMGNLDEEQTHQDYAYLTADSVWTRWLSSQVAVGYRNVNDWNFSNSSSFYAPNNTANPFPGHWAMGVTGSQPMAQQDIPARTKAIRASLLATNEFFGGKVKTNTVIGADDSRTDSAFLTYLFFQADSNWNPVYPGGGIFNGRAVLPSLYWTADNGPQKFPLPYNFWNSRITVNGVNYVKMLGNLVNPALIATADPLGVVLGGANYYVVKDMDQGYYGMNSTEWLDGRLETLVGMRVLTFYKATEFQGTAPTALAPNPYTTKVDQGHQEPCFDIGANYALTSWLRPYFAVSSAFNAPLNQPFDPLGNVPPSGRALEEEVGAKFETADHKVSGSLAVYHDSAKNEIMFITSILERDVNPSGLNGIFRAPSNSVAADRDTDGLQLEVVASPNESWRLRFAAAATQGKIGSNISYNQVYNDQFYEDGKGDVTYADGTVVYVPATFNSKQLTVTSATTGAVPLTVALMSNPSSQYYSQPLPVSGQIASGSNAAKVLIGGADPVHGAILTGITGLPISQMQINPGFTPPGNIVVAASGDKTTNMPGLSFNTTAVYTLRAGWLKGVFVGGTASASWENNKYYYYPNGVGATGIGAVRQLYTLPPLDRFDLIAGYTGRLGRFRFTTQLNVNNIFNHYHVVLLPNAALGYAAPIQATFDQQPRSYLWTTTLHF